MAAMLVRNGTDVSLDGLLIPTAASTHGYGIRRLLWFVTIYMCDRQTDRQI